jgi:hypothetical protein
MPALTDGVPGLEGLHTLIPPSPFSTFTLNDWMSTTTGKTVQWTEQTTYTWVKSIEGLWDAPDQDDPRVKLNYQYGELPLPRIARGRTITYSGILAADTLSHLNAHRAALVACCMNGLVDPTAWVLSVAYDPTYDSSGLVFGAYGIPVGFTCAAWQPNGEQNPVYQTPFQLSFRQSDGRFWVTPDSFLCSVGSSDSPIADGTSGVLTMTGTAPSEPTFTVYGSGSGEATVVLTATEISAKLTIDMPAAMASGDTLVVNFGQRTVTLTHDSVPTDYSGYISWGSGDTNWWNEADVPATLFIGTNTLEVVGDPWSAISLPAVW